MIDLNSQFQLGFHFHILLTHLATNDFLIYVITQRYMNTPYLHVIFAINLQIFRFKTPPDVWLSQGFNFSCQSERLIRVNSH